MMYGICALVHTFICFELITHQFDPLVLQIEEQDVASVSALSPSKDSILSVQSAGEQVEAASKRAIEMGVSLSVLNVCLTLYPF